MTRSRETQIRTVQRKMMRAIIGTKSAVEREELESWVDCMVRSTDIVEQVMSEQRLQDWPEEVHRRIFRWAGRNARLKDNRWTQEVLMWSATGSRKRGRPKSRWTDCLNRFFRQGRQSTNKFWLELALDEETWATLEDDYVNFALGRLAAL